ncbi:hypothetical protein N7468_003023 [Penicillium chermesinum]|uniref:Pyridoxamine 5'-phosphate oxidase N-terminal domain-containing protein n=1 Tax=Penicillium chermesinum TaxID=63820 RepID=A0A9W9TSZ2_9EURO|nr:uncharacterized protein N7468_003023 [Penicillium chermesinum]KAJ5238404.1 hypothetical protein N7468_003023 [Penicillium chermesinum]KAJ6164067.1 hypothetical protein N7470_002739 [Penicillium chermesinum]
MGGYFAKIPESTVQWLLNQKVFWVATAPLSPTGHINISPKGGPDRYFGLTADNRQFWYLDLTGSGSETVSHLYENGRITVQFNAFEGAPRIMRLYGYGKVLEYGTSAFKKFVDQYSIDTIPGSRTIILVDIHQVGFACGYSVPKYEFKEHRTVLNDQFAKKEQKYLAGDEKEDITRYWAEKNSYSMDGLPGTLIAIDTSEKKGIKPLQKMEGPHAPARNLRPPVGYRLEQMILVAISSALVATLLVLYGPRVDLTVLKRGKEF